MEVVKEYINYIKDKKKIIKQYGIILLYRYKSIWII